jgi:putative transposase
MWVGFEEQRHQVTGFVDGMVRLRSETGAAQLILAGELLGHASFRPCVDALAEPDPGTAEPDLGALLDGLSQAQCSELQRMQAHLLEMTTGFRSGEAALAVAGEPRAAYDPALTLQTRVEAKAAELGCSAAVMWKRLQRWREQGVAGLIDRRTVRLSKSAGRGRRG